jgi:SAM-dependent methyltransferase
VGASTIAQQWRMLRGDFELLKGNGVDIGGAGDKLVLPPDHGTVYCWDLEQGDARYMLGAADGCYDFVYSSHCLEHLTDVEEGLKNWVRVLKPGGNFFVIIPDWKLYEHCTWPSIFNLDHKLTFSIDLTREQVGRDNHFHVANDMLPLLESFGLEVLEVRLEDYLVDYERFETEPLLDQSVFALTQIAIIGKKRL